MTDRIDEIRARLAAATPGPWTYASNSQHRWIERETDGYPWVIEPWRLGLEVYEADMELMANAPTDYAYLLGAADDAQDAIYVLAGCVAKEREENDRLQSRLQRAESEIRIAIDELPGYGYPDRRIACVERLRAFLSEGQQ